MGYGSCSFTRGNDHPFLESNISQPTLSQIGARKIEVFMTCMVIVYDIKFTIALAFDHIRVPFSMYCQSSLIFLPYTDSSHNQSGTLNCNAYNPKSIYAYN